MSASTDLSPKKFPTSLTTLFLLLVGGVTLLGFVAPLAAASTLTKDFSTREVMMLVFGSWVVTLLFDAMLIWLLLRLMRVSHQFAEEIQPQRARPEERMPVPIVRLTEPPESITEHTTRNFEVSRYREAETLSEEC